MEESGLRNAGLYDRPLKQSTVLEFKYLLLLRTNASLRLVASDDVLCPLPPHYYPFSPPNFQLKSK